MGALPGTTGRRRLYLMRHGFVDYTSPEVRAAQDPSIAYLTEIGREEARAAGIALSEVHLDAAFHTGLRRTQETAEIVLSEHELDTPPLEFDERFKELRSGQYIDFKSAEQLAATMTFQFEQAGTTLRTGQIEHDRALAVVQPDEVGTLAGNRRVVVTGKVALRTLDLDHFRSGVGEAPTAQGSSDRLLHGDHA